MIRHLKILLLFSLCSAVIYSQTNTNVDSTLREIEVFYNSARYVEAELEARRLFEESSITDSAKVHIEKWIAFSLIAQGKIAPARERFVSLLVLDPDFELDPVLTSPKILSVFNDAKVQYYSLKKLQTDTAKSVALYPAQKITFRTALFPGWEQLHHDRQTSGFLFLGAGILTLGGGITFEVLRADAREKYLKATVLSDIASKYDSYNFYRKAEIYSFIGFAVVYIASEFEVLTFSNSTSLTFHPSQDQKTGNSLTLSIKF